MSPAPERHGFVYMLRCADGSLYTGWTFDVEARVAQHNKGRGSKYVMMRLPAELVYSEERRNRSSAMRREISIKRLSRAQKLELIRGLHGTT